MDSKKNKSWKKDSKDNPQAPRIRRKINFKTKPMVEELKQMKKNNETSGGTSGDKIKERKGNYKKAYAQYERIKAQQRQERETQIKRKKEVKESLEKYNQKKRDKMKKLAARTRKGQPIMKNRIEMLLEKIQSSFR